MTARGPYKKRTMRIAIMLMKRHPEYSAAFATECAKSSWISDVTDNCWLGEAEWKAKFLSAHRSFGIGRAGYKPPISCQVTACAAFPLKMRAFSKVRYI
jgi:hypothetical protein